MAKKSKKELAAEAEAQEAEDARVAKAAIRRYSRNEAKDIIRTTLLESKITFLDVRVSLSDIIIEQAGEHESADAITNVLDLPGIFGFDDDPEGGSEVSVSYVEDAHKTIVRTVTTLSRAFAGNAPGGEEPSEEASEEAPDVEESADEDDKGGNDQNDGNSSNDD